VLREEGHETVNWLIILFLVSNFNFCLFYVMD